MKKLAVLLLMAGLASIGTASVGCDTGASSCELAQDAAVSCGVGPGQCDEGDSKQSCVARCINLVGVTKDVDDEGNEIVVCTNLNELLTVIKTANPDIDQSRNDLNLVFEDLGRLKSSFRGTPVAGAGGAPAEDPDYNPPVGDGTADEAIEVCIAHCWI